MKMMAKLMMILLSRSITLPLSINLENTAVPKKAKIPISKITTSKYCEPINTLYNATHAINCKPIASSARTRSGKVGPLIIRINIASIDNTTTIKAIIIIVLPLSFAHLSHYFSSDDLMLSISSSFVLKSIE